MDYRNASQRPPPAERKPVEQWAKDQDADAAMLAAARVEHGWAEGQELTEAEFAEGLDAVANKRTGYDPPREGA